MEHNGVRNFWTLNRSDCKDSILLCLASYPDTRLELFSDLKIHCLGGSVVEAHRLVLASVSPFLKDIFNSELDEDAISIPGFSDSEVIHFLDVLYKGGDIAQFQELSSCLHLFEKSSKYNQYKYKHDENTSSDRYSCDERLKTTKILENKEIITESKEKEEEFLSVIPEEEYEDNNNLQDDDYDPEDVDFELEKPKSKSSQKYKQAQKSINKNGITKKKRSLVWNHFSQLDTGFSQCKHCDKKIQSSGGSTSSMSIHLNRSFIKTRPKAYN